MNPIFINLFISVILLIYYLLFILINFTIIIKFTSLFIFQKQLNKYSNNFIELINCFDFIS